VAQMENGVPARDGLNCVPLLAAPRYALQLAGEDHPDVQGRAGCITLATVPQPQSAKNGTLRQDEATEGK